MACYGCVLPQLIALEDRLANGVSATRAQPSALSVEEFSKYRNVAMRALRACAIDGRPGASGAGWQESCRMSVWSMCGVGERRLMRIIIARMYLCVMCAALFCTSSSPFACHIARAMSVLVSLVHINQCRLCSGDPTHHELFGGVAGVSS